MTPTAVAPLPVAPPRPRRGLIALGLVLAVVVGAVVGGGSWFLHYSANYRPLAVRAGAGVFFGPDPGSAHLTGVGGTLGSDGRAITGPAGTEQAFVTPLMNTGKYDVRVTGVDGEDLAAVQWSVYMSSPGGVVTGSPAPWHDLPVTLHPHQVIRLRLTVRKPNCAPAQPHGVRLAPSATVRSHALITDHTQLLAVFPMMDSSDRIYLCAPAA